MPKKRTTVIDAGSTALLLVLMVAHTAAQSGLAGKWVGEEQGRGSVTYPVALELTIKGSEATGTVSIGEDPVKAVKDGRVEGATVSFTTSTAMNGREIPMTWRGELKDGGLTFTRALGNGPELPPLSLRRAK